MGQFVNDLIDAVDNDDFEEALLLKADKATTYTITQVNTIAQSKQEVGDYATHSELTDGLATKQPTGDYATHSELTDGLATKQPTGDYATNTALNDGLATKQPTGDYATNTALNDGLATKQPTGDYATNTALNDGLATKQPTGDYATNTALNDGLTAKQDAGDYATKTDLNDGLAAKQPTGDYSTNTALIEGLATKQDVGDYATNTALNNGLATKQPTGNYALESDIPTLAGGYSTSAVDNLLALKADKSELVFRLTGEVDETGNAVKDPNYSLSQAELGARLKLMDDTTQGKQNAGDYITRAEAQQGDATASLTGAVAGGLLGVTSVVWSGLNSGGETITKTAGDFFKDVGDFFDADDSGGTPSLDLSSYVKKPYDWDTANPYYGTSNDLKSYTEAKAKNTSTLESGNLQIKSSGVRIDSTTATPLLGYKLHVEGDTLIRNGTKKYLDCYNDKVGIRVDSDLIDLGCDVKIVGSTCVEGDLKVTGVLKNGADKPYITQEDHDQDITDITDILTDITNAIPTDENGNNQIPAGESFVFQSQITSLPTIENVDNLFDARLQSVGVVDENLALLHYDKTEVDALIPDVSNFETSQQIDTRLADYTTLSLFEAHENLMELELQGKADTTAIPDVSSFITAADLPDTSGFLTSADLPDTSGFLTSADLPDTSGFATSSDISGALLDYDTSAEVDAKITNAGVGGFWTKNATTNELTYNSGNVGINNFNDNPRTLLHLGKRVANSTEYSSFNTIPSSGMGVNADFPRGTHIWAGNSAGNNEEYWGLAMGTTWSGASYIQNLDKSNSSNYYGLLLNPNGGNVGINTTDVKTKLHVLNTADSSGTGDAYLSGRVSKPTECLRLQGKWYNTGSGALLRFTNQHTGGLNPNTGEYNTAGIAGFDDRNAWGGGLVLYTSENISNGGNLTERMIINSYGHVEIFGDRAFDGSTILKLQNEAANYGRTQIHLIGRYENSNDAWSAEGARNAIMFKYQTDNTSAITNAWTIQSFPNIGSKNELGFLSGSNDTPRVVFQGSTGNVGIGTHSPSYKVHIYDTLPSDPCYLKIQGETSNRAGVILAEDSYNHIVMEYDGRDWVGHGYFTLASGYPGWVGHGDGFCYVPENGRCGIGLNDPSCPLQVISSGNQSISSGNYRAYDFDGNLSVYSGAGLHSVTADFQYLVVASAFYARSDERIKENIEDVNDTDALELLRLLEPKKYEYKDKVERGSRKVFGFLAQQIQSVLPECVKSRAEVIPNILETATVTESNVITFNRFNTSNLESNTSTIEINTVQGSSRKVKIVDVIDAKSIKVDADLSNWMGSFDEEGNIITQTETSTLTVEEYEALDEKDGYEMNESNTYTKTTTTNVGNNILVKGEMVDDFLSIDKNYIWTIATSALQEVDRQLQAEKARNDALEARLLALEEKLSNITV